ACRAGPTGKRPGESPRPPPTTAAPCAGPPRTPAPRHGYPRLPRAGPRPIPAGRVTPACHARACRGAAERRRGTRCTGTAARGHHGEGHWPAECPIPAHRDSDRRPGDSSAWRSPPCGGGGGLGASARVAPEVALGEARLRAHTGHTRVCASEGVLKITLCSSPVALQ